MNHLPVTEIAQQLRKASESHPDLKPLLQHAAERLVWQDERYRSLSVMVWGSRTSEPLFKLRTPHAEGQNSGS